MAAKPKFSKIPASLIYAQNWPVPSPSSCFQRSPVKSSSNSHTKSLDNSPWICKPKQSIVRPQKVAKSTSWASCMLNNNYPGWTENDEYLTLDTAKEFKLTVQMFKELTEQVREVDEQLNSGRKGYSFKHYFRNRDKGRLRTYTTEVPMTNEEYQPCNNLGIKREQWQLAIRKSRKTEKLSDTKLENWPLTSSDNRRKTKQSNWKVQSSFHENRDANQILESRNEDLQTNLPIPCNLNLHYSDDDSWSSCLGFSDEDNHLGLGYIDPMPEDWEAMKLEELEMEYCSEKEESDLFMLRLLRIRRSEVETVEQEKGSESNPSNSVPCVDGGVSKVVISSKGKKSTTKGTKSKTNGAVENLEKNPQRVLKKSNNHDKKKDVKDSCNSIEKDRKQKHGERKTECKSARGKRRVQSCKARPESYSSSITYDILELATTFDPPCKERIKSNPRPVTAKSAKSKGMIPGKTWTSQRRFSLTASHSVQSLPSDGVHTVISKSRTSSAKRSSKTKRKRCSSSKL